MILLRLGTSGERRPGVKVSPVMKRIERSEHEMIMNFSDRAGSQDSGDDFRGSTTVRTLLDVDIERPF